MYNQIICKKPDNYRERDHLTGKKERTTHVRCFDTASSPAIHGYCILPTDVMITIPGFFSQFNFLVSECHVTRYYQRGDDENDPDDWYHKKDFYNE